MAEIEHFVNPDKRQTFDKFDKVADLQLSFYSACNQMEGKPPQLMRLADAVKSVSSCMPCLFYGRHWMIASFPGPISSFSMLHTFLACVEKIGEPVDEANWMVLFGLDLFVESEPCDPRIIMRIL